MSYAKIFDSMLASSIWGEPHTTRIVWVTMLLMCDQDGVVEASIDGIAHFARVTIEECEKAMATLSSPDHRSKSSLQDGRRVVRSNSGWVVVNYEAYRDKQSAEERREAARLRQQRKRERDEASRIVTPCHAPSHDVTDVTPSGSGSGSSQSESTDTFNDPPPSEAPRPDGLGASEEERQAEAEAAEAKAAKRAEKEAKEADLLAMFEDFWDTYDKRVGRAPAFKAFRRIVDLEHIIPYIIEAAEKYRKATPDKQFRKHPATWLNQASWQDEIIERAAPSQPQGRNGRFFRPIEHMRNMPLGTPSCDCQGCIDYRLRRMNERNGTHG